MSVAGAIMKMFCLFVTIVIFIVVTFIVITLSITQSLREIGSVGTAPLKINSNNLLISVGLVLLLSVITKINRKKRSQLQRGRDLEL